MIFVNQSVTMIKPDESHGIDLLRACEFAGRNCYASQSKITDNSCISFVKNLIQRGHETPLEFADVTFDITTSRAVLAEITRHRLASFCVESQRYIQEAKTGDITFIIPEWFNDNSFTLDTRLDDDAYKTALLQHDLPNNDHIQDSASIMWIAEMKNAEDAYKLMIADGKKPEEAREVLPNSTACRIIMKANLREWRHIFSLRCSKYAYPQMRSLATQMLILAHDRIPVVFDDLYDQYISDEKGE